MAYVVMAADAPYALNITGAGNGVTLTSGKRYVLTATVACYVRVGTSNAANVTSANGHVMSAGAIWPDLQAPLRMHDSMGNAICAGTDGATGTLFVHEAAER